MVISSSSLQWSRDLYSLLDRIDAYAKSYGLAIFCDGTFKSINTMLNRESFLPKVSEIKTFYHDNEVELFVENYTLTFENAKKVFEYIKRSGVSGGKKSLSFAQTKELIQNYDKNMLEFEVLFVIKE
jgi:malonyl-CoA O-methyltransferase